MENIIIKEIRALEDAAVRDDWEFVEESLEKHADGIGDKQVTDWMQDGRDNIRDLAASVLEARSSKPSSDMMRNLKAQLQDSHIYARFRAACALARHHEQSGSVPDDVWRVLKEALNDDDEEVREIAASYLAALGE